MNWPKIALVAALAACIPGHFFGQASPSPTPSSTVLVATPTPGPTASSSATPAPTITSPLVPPTGQTVAPSAIQATSSFPTPPATPTPTPGPTPPPGVTVTINLTEQEVYLLKDGQVVMHSAISSGRPGHLTNPGKFEIIQKDLDHKSNLYGKFVNKKSGDVVKSGADAAMPVPKGCEFVEAPMKFFMRFDGATGMHAGVLPGYPASHGCVRMPVSKAEAFFHAVEVGTPVEVVGTAPAHHEKESHAHKLLPAPAPTPVPKKHGWWIFHGKN